MTLFIKKLIDTGDTSTNRSLKDNWKFYNFYWIIGYKQIVNQCQSTNTKVKPAGEL